MRASVVLMSVVGRRNDQSGWTSCLKVFLSTKVESFIKALKKNGTPLLPCMLHFLCGAMKIMFEGMGLSTREEQK